MPTKSKKQKKSLDAVANNPEFAQKVGIPQEVGKEFSKADKKNAKKKKKQIDEPIDAVTKDQPPSRGLFLFVPLWAVGLFHAPLCQ